MKIFRGINEILDLGFNPEGIERKELMVEHTVSFSFERSVYISLQKGDNILHNGKKFYLKDDYIPTVNKSTNGFVYDLAFYDIMERMKDIKLKYNGETDFKLTVTGGQFLDVVVSSFSGITKGSFPTDIKEIHFENVSVFDALNLITETYDTEWWLSGSTLNLSKCEFGAPVILRLDTELEDISVSQSSETLVTRLYAKGSTRNIPKGYSQDNRLKLATGYIDLIPDLPESKIIEGVHIFEDIYPRQTTSIVEVIQGSVGDTPIFTIRGNNAFTITQNDVIPGQPLKIAFNTGNLAGREFELIIRADNKFEIKYIQDGELVIPNLTLKPAIGDEFFFFNFNAESVLPTLISQAENELLVAAQDYLDNLGSQLVYDCETRSIHCEQNVIDLAIGQVVTIQSENIGSVTTRIRAYEKQLLNSFECKYQAGDYSKYSRLKEIANRIKDSTPELQTLKSTLEYVFQDGIVTESELKSIEAILTNLSVERGQLNAQYLVVRGNVNLINKTPLETAWSNYQTAFVDVETAINNAITDKLISDAEKANIYNKISVYSTRLNELSAALENARDSIENYKNQGVLDVVDQNKQYLQDQIDGVVDNWFYPYSPTLANYPASDWTTNTIKDRHIGDTFTNTQQAPATDAGKSWRFVVNAGVYSWTQIADSDAVLALQKAAQAQSTADGKSTTYLIQPTKYKFGDMWVLAADQTVNGIAYKSGEILTATQDSTTYNQAHWVKKVRYTDDTAVNNLEIGGRNLILDSKGERFADNTTGSGLINILSFPYLFSRNSEYVFSFDVKGIGQYNFVAGGYIYPIETIASNGAIGTDAGGSIYFDAPDVWERVWIEIRTKNWGEETTTKPLYLRVTAGSNLYLNELKLEKGNKATDWTPAPEDVDAKIADTKLYVEYSTDGTSWHTTFQTNDVYMRQKTGVNGTWTGAIKIVGKDGTSVNIKGKVPTSASLPSSASLGDGYIAEDTGHLWVWTGSWTDAGQIQGDNGANSYIHIAYADDSLGGGFSHNPSGKSWIGIYADFTAIDSDTPSDYTWMYAKGQQGDQGVSISSITPKYAVSTDGANPPISWSNTVPAKAWNEYMWQYEIIAYSNSTTFETAKRVVSGINGADGSNGADGADGADGISITNVTSEYAVSASSTTAPTVFSTTIPTRPAGQYLWVREKVTYSSGIPSYTAARVVTGDKGDTGASAPLLYLSASAQVMKCNPDNTPQAGQTISIEAKLQNVSGTATFVATPYNDAGTAQTVITLGGTGNTRTLTNSQWLAAYKRIEVVATLGSLTDKVTIYRVADGATGDAGQNAIVGLLTNESVTLQANNAGIVSSFAPANGEFWVYNGVTKVTSGITFSKVSETGCTAAITSAGAYSVSAMSADNATVVLRAVYSGVTIDKVLTVSKSKAGADGVSITGVDVEFAKNTNATTPPAQGDAGWSTTAPTLTGTEQLWTRTKTTYSSGNPTYSTPANITPKKGDTGAVGQGIDSVTEEYAISSSKTTQPTTGWSTTQPAWIQGQYIWSRVKVVYKNPAQTIYTGYAVSSEWEAVNDLEIGGRNLLAGLEREYYQKNDTSTVVGLLVKVFNFKRNSEYVISYDIKGSGDSNFVVGGYTRPVSTIASNGQTGADAGGTVIFQPISEWHRVWVKIKTGNWGEEVNSKPINIQVLGNSEIYIKDIKLEKGTKATDWTPAPEDVQAAIDAEKTRINDILSDNIADPSEKQYLSNLWQEIYAEYPRIWAQAYDLGVDRTAYGNAYTDLNNTLSPVLSNMTVNTTVSGTTIRQKFATYYDARTALQNSITNKVNQNAGDAAAVAADAQVKANISKAVTDKFSGFDGGLATAVIMEMREPSTTTRGDATAGISGIQKDINGNFLPAVWTGGTYAQAVAGTAKSIDKHDGSGHRAGGKLSWDAAGNLTVEGTVNATDGEFTGMVKGNAGYFEGLVRNPFVETTNQTTWWGDESGFHPIITNPATASTNIIAGNIPGAGMTSVKLPTVINGYRIAVFNGETANNGGVNSFGKIEISAGTKQILNANYGFTTDIVDQYNDQPGTISVLTGRSNPISANSMIIDFGEYVELVGVGTIGWIVTNRLKAR